MRKRTTVRGVSREVLEMAAVEVLARGQSVRAVARTFQICHVTLQRYIKKCKQLKEEGGTDTSSIRVGYNSHNKVFQPEQEAELLAYLNEASGLHCGLSSIEVRKFAFQLAKHNQLKYPEAWNIKEMAGKDWFASFMKRNPMLPVRNSRPTGLSQGFHRENVSNFFQNLGSVLQCENLEANDIWNVAQTAISTGAAPEEAEGGRGALVTMALAVNALGNSAPPHLVFPTKTFYRHFIRDAPAGSVGSANGCGRMREAEFLVFLRHFVKHTRASVQRKVLLLLDKRSLPVSAAAVDYSDANGVILLPVPQHCAHKLQPLVRGVFGPFRKNLHIAMDCWAKTHAGATANVYDVPGLIAQSLPISITPRNITSGFQTAGIWPFNSNIFDEEDLASSLVVGVPDLMAAVSRPPSVPSTSAGAAGPFRTAEPRKAADGCTKRETSAAVPDSPVDPALEEEADGGKTEEAEPPSELQAQVKREGASETDLSTEGDSPCLFSDDYCLITV